MCPLRRPHGGHDATEPRAARSRTGVRDGSVGGGTGDRCRRRDGHDRERRAYPSAHRPVTARSAAAAPGDTRAAARTSAGPR
ncbi:hypothetical protein AWV63_16070 [Micromonospora rifamycinica]|nr:hypothetical protein AWV63_16070 [Micromonospora rifamycinica]